MGIGRVLVTGITGFLGSHVAFELLRQGFAVRGTLRDMSRADQLRGALSSAGADVSRLEFRELDLIDERGWSDAVQDCRFIQHVASPFFLTMPRDGGSLIRPAVEGTGRVLRVGLDAGAERIVLTSSLAAIDGGHARYDTVLGPNNWTRVEGPFVTAYARSKTLAEREAWAIADARGATGRLVVINPGTMLGPLLDQDPGTSATIVQRLLRGDMPMIPDLILPYVDVRDVALCLVRAMTEPQAGGRRHILTNPAERLTDIAQMLRQDLGPEAYKVPTRRLPDFMVPLLSLFDRSLKDSRAYIATPRRYDASSGNALLGRALIPTREALRTTASSLLERRLV